MATATIPTVLLIEGNSQYARILQRHMKADFTVDFAFSSTVALRKLTDHTYDIVLVSGHLPDLLATNLCQQIRALLPKILIIAILDDSGVQHRINALTAGADGWLGVPLHYSELLCLCQTLLRRRPMANNVCLRYHDLELHTSSRTVKRAGQSISLTPKQFAALECLLLHAGSVVSREVFTRHVWDFAQTGWNQTIDVHISTLRSKIDRPFSSNLIHTVRGHGYKLSAEA
ncbi:MAG: two component transcriptional regulator, winged helix family [Candidatus Saccharibacteria bacterium]|nr:two component transcriptional regulator, winged helix family [Candidatus Saccharibacteria bacterium]